MVESERESPEAKVAEGGAGRGVPSPSGPPVLSVRELAKRIRGTLEGSLGTINVRGEISNLRRPGSQHLYFSLKDENASIRAVLFRGQARFLRFRPENGQEVVARGRVTFYEAGGDAQIVCDTLEPVGSGALALAFEQLKAKLAKEGLFDRERKKEIPFLPLCIGVVTSPSGAAIRDFLHVLHRRFHGISVRIAPSRVQGTGAAAEIAEGVRRLDADPRVDVIVVTRGGGSIEDLWAFNEEIVARAIAEAKTPVVSAVGHEVDFTIADFVADLRAPTPSGAAELLAPVERELRDGLRLMRARLLRASMRQIERERASARELRSRLSDPRRWLVGHRLKLDGTLQLATEALRRALSREWRRLDERSKQLQRANPTYKLQIQRRKLADLRQRLAQSRARLLRTREERRQALVRRLWALDPSRKMERERGRLASMGERLAYGARRHVDLLRRDLSGARASLEALSPLAVLSRGYAIAFTEEGKAIRASSEVNPGALVHLELGKGALKVEVLQRSKGRREAANEREVTASPGEDDTGEGKRKGK